MNGAILSNPENLPTLPVRGVTPLSTVDFPGRLSAVFYTQGCPWRCGYCFNRALWPFDADTPLVSWTDLHAFLEKRRGFLDGVVFSGGEPTAHEDLSGAMRYVRAMGFHTGLHTNGMSAERLRKILPFCDWIGMDIKAPFRRYEKVTGVEGSGLRVRVSVSLLLQENFDCEFRTTVDPDYLTEGDLREIGTQLALLGARRYVLQPSFDKGDGGLVTPSLRRFLSGLFSSCYVRGGVIVEPSLEEEVSHERH